MGTTYVELDVTRGDAAIRPADLYIPHTYQLHPRSLFLRLLPVLLRSDAGDRSFHDE